MTTKPARAWKCDHCGVVSFVVGTTPATTPSAASPPPGWWHGGPEGQRASFCPEHCSIGVEYTREHLAWRKAKMEIDAEYMKLIRAKSAALREWEAAHPEPQLHPVCKATVVESDVERVLAWHSWKVDTLEK